VRVCVLCWQDEDARGFAHARAMLQEPEVYRRMGISSGGRMVRGGMGSESPVTSPVLQWDQELSLFRVVQMPPNTRSAAGEAEYEGPCPPQRLRRSFAVSEGLSDMTQRMPE